MNAFEKMIHMVKLTSSVDPMFTSLTDKNENPIPVKAQLWEGKRQGKIKA